MDSRSTVLANINKAVADENGMPVKESNTLSDTGLDSLGFIYFFERLNEIYGLFEKVPPGEEYAKYPLSTSISTIISECKRTSMEKTSV